MNDRLREFDIFLRVTEEGSFSAAARTLDCDPSTVSKVVQRMENRLGVRLFQRTSRALALTQEGARFHDSAQRVVEALQEAENVAAGGGADASGTLRINCILALAAYHLAPHLPEFLRRHPRLRLDFVLTATPMDMFENQIDISLRGGYIPDSTLVAKRIATGRWVVCASPEYLQRAGTPRTPAELAKHNCLNFLPGSYRSRWPMREGGPAGSELEVQGNIGTNSPDLLRTLACGGLGIARLSEMHVGHDLQNGRLVPLLEEFQSAETEPVFAVYPSRRNLSPRVKAFLEFFDEQRLMQAPAGGAPRW